MPKEVLESNTEQVYKQIEKELGKTKKDVDDYVNILQEWLKTQPHLPEIPSPEVIKSFLLFNKFSIERCKQKLDMYYTIRSVIPEMFDKHPCSPEMIEQARVSPVVPLPKLAKDSRRIIYTTFSDNYAPEMFNHERFSCHTFNIFELLLREDLFLGSHFIYDCAGFKLGHVTRLNLTLVKKLSTVMEKVFSNRVTSVHLINFQSALETTFNLVKPLLPSKIQERIQIHKNSDDLLEIFSKEVLPKDLGGDELSVAELTELWIKKLESEKDLFSKLLTLKADESKRPKKLVNDDLLGFYGNFKKLEVD